MAQDKRLGALRWLSAVLLFLSACIAPLDARKAGPVPSADPPHKICVDSVVSAAVQATNDLRQRRSLPALACDERGGRVARYWAQEMCNRRELSHENFHSNCDFAFLNWCHENVAAHAGPPSRSSVRLVVEGQWWKSEAHKAVLLADVDRVAYGYHACDDGFVYWVGLYGKRW